MFGTKRKQRESAEKRRQGIVAELTAMLREANGVDRSFISDMILYAEVGRDRMNLGDDYVAKVREQIGRWA